MPAVSGRNKKARRMTFWRNLLFMKTLAWPPQSRMGTPLLLEAQVKPFMRLTSTPTRTALGKILSDFSAAVMSSIIGPTDSQCQAVAGSR